MSVIWWLHSANRQYRVSDCPHTCIMCHHTLSAALMLTYITLPTRSLPKDRLRALWRKPVDREHNGNCVLEWKYFESLVYFWPLFDANGQRGLFEKCYHHISSQNPIKPSGICQSVSLGKTDECHLKAVKGFVQRSRHWFLVLNTSFWMNVQGSLSKTFYSI